MIYLRKISLFLPLLTCLFTHLAAHEILYLDSSTTNNFAYDERTSFQDMNVWQKISYMLARHNIKIRSLNDLDLNISPVRQLFFVDYRGHPAPKEMRRFPKESLLSILFEPPAVFDGAYDRDCYSLFSKVFTFHDGLVDGKKFIKFRYFSLRPMRKDITPFHERNLCCGVFGNKRSHYSGELYSERLKIIRFFEQHHPNEFGFYGIGWDQSHSSIYLGATEDKSSTIKNYKFNIAYENTKDVPGYITEKIFDCFEAGVVPIYWGSPTVTDEIPAGCFIDRRQFASDEALYNYLISIDEETFQTYLENIREYLDSEEAKVFDRDHFVLSIVNGLLQSDYKIEDLQNY